MSSHISLTELRSRYEYELILSLRGCRDTVRENLRKPGGRWDATTNRVKVAAVRMRPRLLLLCNASGSSAKPPGRNERRFRDAGRRFETAQTLGCQSPRVSYARKDHIKYIDMTEYTQ
jgi:hypothetical protein